ncbi:MAG: GNAT family N-acetyltransferase [Streptomycetales bacterium]
MHIERLAPADEASLQDWFEVARAAWAVDLPDDPEECWEEFAGRLHHQRPDEPEEVWLARGDEGVLGGCWVQTPMQANRETAVLEATVHPAHRRRGVGLALLHHVADQVRAAGRSRLILESLERLVAGTPAGSPGVAFLQAIGAERALDETRRRLDVSTVDDEAHARLLADAAGRSAGYSMLPWAGSTPAEQLPAIARLVTRLEQDAPLDGLAWQPETWDAERARAADAVNLARSRRTYTTAARDDATGELAGFTSIVFPAYPSHFAYQEATVVNRDHRGRRLGMRLKIENLRLARHHEPALRLIDTWNATSNGHMIAVNEAMGFRAHSQGAEWQLEIDALTRTAPVTRTTRDRS